MAASLDDQEIYANSSLMTRAASPPESASWGGARPGAGRKRGGARPRVSHLERERFAASRPVHVTLRMREAVPSLRRRGAFSTVHRVLSAAKERFGVRICHYSVQSNHIHLIVEARGREALSRALQGFGIRLAKRLNARFGRRGAVLADRYHARPLTSPRDVRTVLRYVLGNFRKHDVRGPRFAFLDPFSSALWFDGLRGARGVEPAYVLLAKPEWAPLGRADPRLHGRGPEVAPPRTAWLTTSWRRHGLIGYDEAPRRR